MEKGGLNDLTKIKNNNVEISGLFKKCIRINSLDSDSLSDYESTNLNKRQQRKKIRKEKKFSTPKEKYRSSNNDNIQTFGVSSMLPEYCYKILY
jgi:hypothetical protein